MSVTPTVSPDCTQDRTCRRDVAANSDIVRGLNEADDISWDSLKVFVYTKHPGPTVDMSTTSVPGCLYSIKYSSPSCLPIVIKYFSARSVFAAWHRTSTSYYLVVYKLSPPVGNVGEAGLGNVGDRS